MPRGRVRFRHFFLLGRNSLAFAVSMVIVMFVGIIALIVWHVRAEKSDKPYDEVIDNSLDEDDLWHSNVKVKQSYLDECERCENVDVNSGHDGGDGGHREPEDDAGSDDGAGERQGAADDTGDESR